MTPGQQGPFGLPARTVEDLRKRLLAWFARNARDLPWRSEPSLYATWISEMMLQQTTVAAVVPRFRAFLERFPDVAALAAAAEPEVLAAWSGLGYYSRARNLHRAAGTIVAELDGELPRTRDGWRRLPGIGDYAAGAIASIGLGERVAAVDANVRRVLLRLLCAEPAAAAELPRSRLAAAAAELVDPQRPGAWNEALMELGAVVCLPRDPACGECPFAAVCRARRGGTAAAIPPAPTRARAVPVELCLLVMIRDGLVLFLPPGSAPVGGNPHGLDLARGDFSTLHRGLWGLPSTPWFHRPAGPRDWDPAAVWAPVLGKAADRAGWGGASAAGTFSHAITRYRLLVHVHALRLGPGAPDETGIGGSPKKDLIDPLITHYNECGRPSGRFRKPGAADLPLSGLAAKALDVAMAAQG